MKRLYFITGMPLAGKSVLAAKMAEYIPNSEVIRTSGIVQELLAKESDIKKATEDMANNDMYMGEEALRAEIVKRVEDAKSYHIIIEGMPRNSSQLNWIRDTFWHYFPKLIVADVGGSYETLYNRARARARNEYDTNPEKLVKRLYIAANNIYGLYRDCQKYHIPVKVVNTNQPLERFLVKLAEVVKNDTWRSKY